MEKQLIVRVLEKDKDLVKDILGTCEKKFAQINKEQLGSINECSLTIDTKNFLKEKNIIDIQQKTLEEIGDSDFLDLCFGHKAEENSW